MYSVYKIYQSDVLVYVVYHDIIPEFTDTTKLKLIFNNPTLPSLLFESYFKAPELFSITTYETGIYNILDASKIVTEQNQLIGIENLSLNTIKNKTKNTTKKPRIKKAPQSEIES